MRSAPILPILLSCASPGALVGACPLRGRRGGAALLAGRGGRDVRGRVGRAMARLADVPVDRPLMTWSIDAPPADLDVVWTRGELPHTVRTPVAVVVFVLQAVALAIEAVSRRAGSP